MQVVKKEGENKTSLFSLKALVFSLILGGITLLIVLAGIHIPIPATGVVTDPRESFTTFGAALSGPIGAIIIGILAGIAEPGGIALASLLAHISGALWMGFIYKKYIYEKDFFFLKWVGSILAYYYVFAVPGFAIGLVLFYNDPAGVLGLWWGISKGVTVEVFLTILITTAVLFVMPKRYRKPLW